LYFNRLPDDGRSVCFVADRITRGNAMSTIATFPNLSGLKSVAQLLAGSFNTATTQIPQSGSSAPGATSSSPSDILDLSDHAKATLARAQQDKLAADKLQGFLQSVRNAKADKIAGPGQSLSQQGPSQASNAQTASQASDDVTKIFDQLTGQAQAPTQTQGPTQAQQSYYAPNQSFEDFYTAQTTALEANARQPDGTIANYSATYNDISFTPTTPEAINNWYQNEGQSVIQWAQQVAQQAPGTPQAAYLASYAQAVENHAVTFQNAFDVPDLDYHNTLTIEGGEHGGENNWSVTYNHGAAIFKDPTTNYAFGDAGTIITWKNPQATATTPTTTSS
jgi:hypothetical protein